MEKENLIKDKTFEFALAIIDLYKRLNKQNEFVISKQLLRSGTSIGANVEEAIAAQSRKDFVHKLSISLKEARETRYWLRLLKESKLAENDFSRYLSEIEQIIAILIKIIKSCNL
ncbi:MAG: four helix bundle protein [Elusimicrobia bacterium RIFOXYA2_FULL_39_19]|nr:MAG: four helix bundle protein [Elusimicrobia bacterium RIFOXYA2_FULL_39_19]